MPRLGHILGISAHFLCKNGLFRLLLRLRRFIGPWHRGLAWLVLYQHQKEGDPAVVAGHAINAEAETHEENRGDHQAVQA